MKLTGKQVLQVVLSLALAGWIFWFLYKDISWTSLTAMFLESSFFWLTISLIISVVGFWLRAWRWALLIDADAQIQTKTVRAFVALMVGYLANLVVPRAGEIARCGVLVKTEGKQLGGLIGTVVLERTIDLLFMLGTILLAFIVERQLFLSLFGELVSLDALVEKISGALPLVIGGFSIALLFLFLALKKYQDHSVFKKIRHFLRDMVRGIISLRKVKNQWGFWGSSTLIWVSYYFTMLTVAWAIPATASLSLSSVLLVMVMGSIGMIAPVQGGIGTFHALVAYILIAFGLEEADGKIFAAIIHGVQMLLVIFLGLFSLGYFLKITAQKASKTS
ncbi:lysylphosphatidylglycerol synthase transmembrane domain-containing protein [Mongoliitalea daihaiensis]|uniref:lysylphosphatidylglycerol synthase transmembrane domain-containing protein n=1 Tax=Mongoliitalea daihaiensis TaxID=2782006 RepID=UPI001F240C0E|nr:lysylphosphatidylglycerol synthase transmembrane domain-containing protein [Mongoliitalea daihaiensis]UJP66262.1 flippase-like domain-containing protein [Mongoliitalea daihaiensis]